MAWVRIEDAVTEHRKHLKAGPAACWLWVCGIAYCQRQLSDGFIPTEALGMLGVRSGVTGLVDKLVEVGLFDRVADGVRVHDYHDYNDTRDEALTRRDAVREQRRKAGVASGRSRRVERKMNEPVERVLNPLPSHPLPSHVVPSELRRRGGQPPLQMNLRRLKIWRWMVEEFIEKLGNYAEAFDLDAWIRERDEQETRVIPGDWWDYWLPAFEAEVQRRGLPIAAAPQLGKTNTRLAAALASIAASEKA